MRQVLAFADAARWPARGRRGHQDRASSDLRPRPCLHCRREGLFRCRGFDVSSSRSRRRSRSRWRSSPATSMSACRRSPPGSMRWRGKANCASSPGRAATSRPTRTSATSLRTAPGRLGSARRATWPVIPRHHPDRRHRATMRWAGSPRNTASTSGRSACCPLQSFPNIVSALAGNQADSGMLAGTPGIRRGGQGRGASHRLGRRRDAVGRSAASSSPLPPPTTGPTSSKVPARLCPGRARLFSPPFSGPRRQPPRRPDRAEALAIIAKTSAKPPEKIERAIGFVDPDARFDEADILHQIAWYKAQAMLKDRHRRRRLHRSPLCEAAAVGRDWQAGRVAASLTIPRRSA